jgi:fructose-bisphosphate aldolase, class I
MNIQQAEIMRSRQGFIAALDQSGGSTPIALAGYGVPMNQYKSEEEMFDLVHAMRTRIIKSPAFIASHILAAIIFEQTMDRTIEGLYTGDYLWEKKGIVPILKVDQGLSEEANGVQLMEPITDLDSILDRAINRKIFGTKMRSLIKRADPEGIYAAVQQQFEYGKKICKAGLVPIVEPEVDIMSPDKAESENILKKALLFHLDQLSNNETIMLKLSIPSNDDFYNDMIHHPRVMRVMALSGGYSRDDAVKLLARNPGLIASFSRALLEDLNEKQPDEEFNAILSKSIQKIYQASIT